MKKHKIMTGVYITLMILNVICMIFMPECFAWNAIGYLSLGLALWFENQEYKCEKEKSCE